MKTKYFYSIVLVLISALFSCQTEPDKILFKGRILYFTQSTASINEDSESPLLLTAELSSPAKEDVTISFEITENGALEDVDFEIVDATIVIPAGEYQGTLAIYPINNSQFDASRKLVVSMTDVDVSGIDLSYESTSTVSIVNDDCPVKTGIWTVAKADNALEVDGDYIYTATFSPNEAGDCNILVVYNIGDWGPEARATMTFTPDFEGATTGTVSIAKQGINSFGSSGERTAEGTGTYDEVAKTITIFITYKYGNGDIAWEDTTIFDAN